MMLMLSGCSGQPTVWDGAYTVEQAARGRSVYENHCTLCHDPDLTGLDGRLKGDRFIEDWREDNLSNLFIQIKRGMPAENPSSLTDSEYLEVLTYILQENGFPRGRAALKFETLESIAIVSRDGPKPLPKGAMIQTFGCLAREGAENWRLTNAADFKRGRNRQDLSAEELNRLDQQRRGSQTVALDIVLFRRFLGKGIDLANYEGRKVVITGRLETAEGRTSRVMLFTAQPMGSICDARS